MIILFKPYDILGLVVRLHTYRPLRFGRFCTGDDDVVSLFFLRTTDGQKNRQKDDNESNLLHLIDDLSAKIQLNFK